MKRKNKDARPEKKRPPKVVGRTATQPVRDDELEDVSGGSLLRGGNDNNRKGGRYLGM